MIKKNIFYSLCFFSVITLVSCEKKVDEIVKKETKEVKETKSNTSPSTHKIVIHPNNRVVSLLMSTTEYSSWKTNDDFNNTAVRENLFKDIYKKFKDDFDFILLVLNEKNIPSNLYYSGQLIQVSNNVSNIGLNIFDESSKYGSLGKLQAVMQLNIINALLTGPSLHELMHNWGNFGIPTESVSKEGTSLKSNPFKPHFGFTGGNTKGQLGGFKQSTLVNNGGNLYTVDEFGPNANGGNSVTYNELELYLMGMIPLSKVSPFDAFGDITSLSINKNNKTHMFNASKKMHYTPKKIEKLLGKRNPSYITSQKKFKLLVVILTDKPLTEDQWDLVDNQSEEFSRNSSDGKSYIHNFWEATKGRATIESGNLQKKLKN